MGPLAGTVVLDLSSGIAGAYCTKLLADGGADVVKVEDPTGDPLRRWSASGAAIAPGDDGALFSYLSGSKRSVVVDAAEADAGDTLARLCAAADVVVWSEGSALAGLDPCVPDALRAAHPHLVVVTISPFGLDGPWVGRAATEFTLQAWSGGAVGLGPRLPRSAPLTVGGQVGEWLAGTYAAIGVLASLARQPGRRRRRGARRRVDARSHRDVPHLLPGHVRGDRGSAVPLGALGPVARGGDRERRPRRARHGHRAAVARPLRDGRPSRVGRRRDAARSAGASHPRSASGRRSAPSPRSSTSPRRSASRTHRSATAPASR